MKIQEIIQSYIDNKTLMILCFMTMMLILVIYTIIERVIQIKRYKHQIEDETYKYVEKVKEKIERLQLDIKMGIVGLVIIGFCFVMVLI